MSSKPSWPTIDVRPEPNPRLAYVFVSATLLAAIIVVFIPLHWSWRLAILLLIAGYSWWQYQHFALLKGKHVVRRAVWHGDGRWDIEFSDESKHPARLLGSSVVSVPMIVLRLKVGERLFGRRVAMFLTTANVDAENLRALRVRLRLASQ